MKASIPFGTADQTYDMSAMLRRYPLAIIHR